MSGKKKPGLSTNKRAYECVCFSVTYNGNSNTGGVVPVDESTYSIGSNVAVLGNSGSLVKRGYIFDGWNTAVNGSGTNYINGTLTIIENTTLYSKWVPIIYTVVYYGNTNTSGVVPIDETSYIIGNTVTVLGNSGFLAKSGYAFAGWNTLADGSGTNYDVGDTFVIDENTSLYAQWSTVYTVTYDGNNETSGVVPVDGLSYLGGTAVTVLENSGYLENIGYAFAGWNTLADGSGTNYDVGDTFIINANEYLYAQWVIRGFDLII